LWRWAQQAKTSQVLALRAKIVLACAEGRDGRRVAAGLRTTEHKVSRWRGWFIRQRLDGLHDVVIATCRQALLAPRDQVRDVSVAILFHPGISAGSRDT